MKIFSFLFAVLLFAFFAYQSPSAPLQVSAAPEEIVVEKIAVSENVETADDWFREFEEEVEEVGVYKEPELGNAVLVL